MTTYTATSPATGTTHTIETGRVVKFAIIAHRESYPTVVEGEQVEWPELDKVLSFHATRAAAEKALANLKHGDTLGTGAATRRPIQRFIVEVS